MPSSPAKLNVTMRLWGGGKNVFRVHPAAYKALEFNSTSKGDARFSPLYSADGKVIPTLYAGSTLDCALMETVFHDVPFVNGPKLHSKAKHVVGKVVSTLQVKQDLSLIDLTSIPLRKLGVRPEDITRTDASRYAETRARALVMREENPEAQGLLWTSRQDDTALAVVLFGDRVNAGSLDFAGDSFSLTLPDGSARSEVQDLAARLDVLLI